MIAMMWKKVGRWLLVMAVLVVLILPAPEARAAATEEIYEKSGAGELAGSLDKETRDLLDGLGAEDGFPAGTITGEAIFDTLSGLVRDKLAGPLKALAAVVAVSLLCRLCGSLEDGEADLPQLVAAAACGLVMAGPVLGLLSACQRVAESAAAFLGAAVPVYAGLLAATGSAAAGGGYSVLAMLAGEAIPVLSAGFLLPLLRISLAFSLTAAVSGPGLGRLSGSLYALGKWALVMAVTLYAGVLSVQTALNAQVDAAASKAAKLALSTGVPIVGGALGDAVAAIQNSVRIVKSGVGAFGILAAICIFAPGFVECLLWSGVCLLGQIAGDLLEAPKLSGLMGAFSGAVKMILAMMAGICAVCVATAAAVIFVSSGG